MHTSIAAARQKVREILQERLKSIEADLKRDIIREGTRMQKTVTKKKGSGPWNEAIKIDRLRFDLAQP